MLCCFWVSALKIITPQLKYIVSICNVHDICGHPQLITLSRLPTAYTRSLLAARLHATKQTRKSTCTLTTRAALSYHKSNILYGQSWVWRCSIRDNIICFITVRVKILSKHSLVAQCFYVTEVWNEDTLYTTACCCCCMVKPKQQNMVHHNKGIMHTRYHSCNGPAKPFQLHFTSTIVPHHSDPNYYPLQPIH